MFNNNGNEGLTLTEAAEYSGMTRNALKKRCDRKTINFFIDEKGVRKILLSELEYIAQKTFDELPYNPYDYDPKFDIPKAEIWGNGKAPVIKPSTTEYWEVVGGWNDIHVPYHDTALIDSAIALFKDIQPHRFVNLGDTNDFFMLSRFNKAMERLDLLQQELDQGKLIRKAIRDVLPNAQMDEIVGNHEERLLTYPGFNAPALRSLNSLKPNVLLGLKDLDITHWPMNGFRLRDDFLMEHGSVVRTESGASAKARLNQTLISGIMGHSHRLSEHRKSGYRDLVWYEGGCLCMLNPDYVKSEANWKQAVWLGMFSTKTQNFHMQMIPAVGRGFIFDGKHYGDTKAEQDLWVGPSPSFEQDIPSDFMKIVKGA